jgi:hypothetical protein
MVPGDEFSGGNGDTITVRVPQPAAARTQASAGSALTADALNEVPVDVTLSHKYHLHNVTDQELTYEIEDFARQITLPQVQAVALGVEDSLASVINALSGEGAAVNWDSTPTEADDKDTILDAREFLGAADCPPEDRFLACAPDLISRLLKYDFLTDASQANSDDALRNAVIGRMFGFNIIESNALDAGESIAYHRSGLVMAVRAPLAPRGATSSSSASAQGIGMRQVFQYDASVASDQSLVSAFVGAAAVYEDSTGTDNARFVKITAGT